MTGRPIREGGAVPPQSGKDATRPFVPGRPTGAMDHVDENPRPHVLKGTDVKVEPEKKRREAQFTPTSVHTHQ